MSEERYVVVMGGNGLIGRATVTKLKEDGMIPIICDITKPTTDDIYFEIDITNRDNLNEKINELFDAYSLVGWVNLSYPRSNSWMSSLDNLNEEDLIIDINNQLISNVLVTKYVAEHFREMGIKGSIVNIGSIYGSKQPDFRLYEGLDMTCPPAYPIIKSGLAQFTKYCSKYYGKYGVRLNMVSPGGVFNHQPKEFVDRYEKKVSLGRMASARDVAHMISFLCSSSSNYITGQEILVDGGFD